MIFFGFWALGQYGAVGLKGEKGSMIRFQPFWQDGVPTQLSFLMPLLQLLFPCIFCFFKRGGQRAQCLLELDSEF